MRGSLFIALGIFGLTICHALLAQKPFKEYPAIEYNDFPLPPDWNQKAEWTRARLRYPDVYGYPDSMPMSRFGPYPGRWTMDYPRSDRHLLQGVRRLTRIDTRSVEQVVSFGEDDMYNYPMMYAVEVGYWRLGDREANQLREFLTRGGFLMVDDFHGTEEWRIFTESMRKVFPDRPITAIPNNDPIFHTLYDLDQRFQVPGAQIFRSGRTYERDGFDAEWLCIRDDKGRILVAICHNMDLGDAWEHSDEARYLEKWASLAYRIAMNYFVYDLTH